jgi:hypothetical protein
MERGSGGDKGRTMNASAVALSPPAISKTIPRLSVVRATDRELTYFDPVARSYSYRSRCRPLHIPPRTARNERRESWYVLPMLMNTMAVLIKTCRRCENGWPG